MLSKFLQRIGFQDSPPPDLGPRELSPEEREFARLPRVKTLGELYETIPTLKIGILQRPDIFAGFGKKIQRGSEVINGHVQLQLHGHQDNTGIKWAQSRSLSAAMQEPFSIVKAFEDSAFDESHKELSQTIRRKLAEDDSGFRFALVPHVDDDAGDLSRREYLCASKKPTKIVSHSDTLDLLGRHAPQILDLSVKSPVLGGKIYEVCRKHADAFSEAAKPLDANAVYGITCATVHMADIEPDRVFYRTLCR